MRRLRSEGFVHEFSPKRSKHHRHESKNVFADLVESRSAGLPPNRLPEIDLLLIGEGASTRTNGASDQSTFHRRSDQKSTNGADTCTDASTRDGPI
jgi:hypothetical protein